MHRSLVIMLAAALPLSAAAAQDWITVTSNNQPIIEGSGNIVRQARPVGGFRKIELNGAANLEVRLGAAPSLVVVADDNLLPQLTSRVDGDTLEIETRGSYRTRRAPVVRVTVPDLRSVRSTGSGDVIIDGVANKELALSTQGSGDMRVAGRTGKLEVKIEGSGSSDLRRLAAGNVRVVIHGSGDAEVRTDGALAAAVYGSGSIRYSGRPAALSVTRHGSGSVVAAN